VARKCLRPRRQARYFNHQGINEALQRRAARKNLSTGPGPGALCDETEIESRADRIARLGTLFAILRPSRDPRTTPTLLTERAAMLTTLHPPTAPRPTAPRAPAAAAAAAAARAPRAARLASRAGLVRELDTAEEWAEFVAAGDGATVVVDYFTSWCGPCKVRLGGMEAQRRAGAGPAAAGDGVRACALDALTPPPAPRPPPPNRAADRAEGRGDGGGAAERAFCEDQPREHARRLCARAGRQGAADLPRLPRGRARRGDERQQPDEA
jgi:hypothetical protein